MGVVLALGISIVGASPASDDQVQATSSEEGDLADVVLVQEIVTLAAIPVHASTWNFQVDH